MAGSGVQYLTIRARMAGSRDLLHRPHVAVQKHARPSWTRNSTRQSGHAGPCCWDSYVAATNRLHVKQCTVQGSHCEHWETVWWIKGASSEAAAQVRRFLEVRHGPNHR